MADLTTLVRGKVDNLTRFFVHLFRYYLLENVRGPIRVSAVHVVLTVGLGLESRNITQETEQGLYWKVVVLKLSL
jgi:hypothetical protein